MTTASADEIQVVRQAWARHNRHRPELPGCILSPVVRIGDVGHFLKKKDLYILTSHDTFSAPEAFAYDMQAQGRAKIVGEVTGGVAHGTKPYRLSAHFVASIPFNREINAVTHTDYEGVGVKPDLQVPAKEALLTAHILALRGVLARTTGEPERKADLEKLIGELEAKLKSGNMEE